MADIDFKPKVCGCGRVVDRSYVEDMVGLLGPAGDMDASEVHITCVCGERTALQVWPAFDFLDGEDALST